MFYYLNDPGHRLDQQRPERLNRAGAVASKLMAELEFMPLVRVLLVGMSNLLRNIITAALAEGSGITVVGNAGEPEDIDTQVRLTGVDAVIFQSSEPEAGEKFMSLLRHSPAIKVVAIDGSANSGFVHQLRLCSTRLAELSVEALDSALR